MKTHIELQSMVDSIARDLRAVYDGNYNFYSCEIVDDVDAIIAAESHDDAYESDFGGGFYRYFENPLDVEYRVDSSFCYKGAIITVALGGPSILIDTRLGEVRGYWWNDFARAVLWRDVVDAIDGIFEDYFNCSLG